MPQGESVRERFAHGHHEISGFLEGLAAAGMRRFEFRHRRELDLPHSRPWRMKSATCSPTTMVEALVLARTQSGMMEEIA